MEGRQRLGKLGVDIGAVPHSGNEGKHEGVGIEAWGGIMRTVFIHAWGGNEIEKKPH